MRRYTSHSKAKAGHKRAKRKRHELIREHVREHRRFDIFVKHVLHLKPEPHHLELMEWQDECDEGMILAWRGAAKTTYLTEARAAFEVICDPNIRILLASDAQSQSKDFLRAVKSYLESEDVVEIFGDFKAGAVKWSEDQIIVARSSVGVREATIMCTGMDTVLPSRHFDMIIVDDLVTEDNSRTQGQREKTQVYWLKTLSPCLRQRGGRMWVIGTRYHEEDLYGYLAEGEFKDAHLVMGLLDEETDQSRWEAEFPTERAHRRRALNLGIFELQYQCITGKLLGGIFSPDHFQYIDSLEAIPVGSCFKWQGADLAIGQNRRHDFFSHVTLYMQRLVRNPFLVEWHLRKLKFPAQVSFCAKQFEKHPDAIRLVIERNAYQDALRQQVLEEYPEIPAVGQWTLKDKITRGEQRAVFLTHHPLRVLREHEPFVRLLCGFPDRKGSKDAFDALDITISRALRGARKRARGDGDEEVGLI